MVVIPVVFDLDGNVVKAVEVTASLQELAEDEICDMVRKTQAVLETLKQKYEHVPELAGIVSTIVDDAVAEIGHIIPVVKTGVVTTHFLGVESEDDFTELRKSLLKEMMYIIDNRKE